jgi:excisionase family DNA binding protein
MEFSIMTGKFLTPQEAADLLQVPVSFIYDRTRRNAIPLRRIGKYVRIPQDELLQWVDRLATKEQGHETSE